ncbi:MAG TPA: methyltransferase, TIGR04325 family [Bacteroidia bacterium]|uniref:methyltransferase, TIGR04325 family n=1 Tax=Candidatus Pollutiaquabacter sp. TaxID=3416354 RepID=UPI002B852194|nr:methyltransferase, TIGR04325 family [Bacteroidota bacterium]HRU61236.1 methyltransferase, TIGR04325 family [Bacteroidia bacterium]
MLRSRIRDLLPAFVMRWYRHRRWKQGLWPKSEWRGDYPSWASAEADSQGYENAMILERVTAATRAVQEGRAAFERDAVTFPERAFDPAVLAALQAMVAESGGTIELIDFGGSLGSLYYQYRPLLNGVKELRWVVVEQPHFVERGKSITPPGELSFTHSLSEIPGGEVNRVLLLGSVLSYLPDPWEFIREAQVYRFRFILIDRTACIRGRPTRLTVQYVPETVYPASYPAWLFRETDLKNAFKSDYQLRSDSVSPFSSLRIQEDGAEVEWKSFFFERKR